MTTIYFQDDFESEVGTIFSLWDGTWGSAEGIIVTSPVHAGSHAASFVAGQNLVKTGMSLPSTTLHARMWFMMPTTLNEGEIMSFFAPGTTPGTALTTAAVSIMGPGWHGIPDKWTIGIYNPEDGSYKLSQQIIITTGVWHCIEAAITFGTNGSLQLWLDGISILAWNGNTGTNHPVVFNIGWVGPVSGTDTTLVIDDVIVADDYIGTGAAPPPSPPVPIPTGRLIKGIVAYLSPMTAEVASNIGSHFDIADTSFDVSGWTQIKTANPNTVVIGYKDLIGVYAPDASWPETWFVHDINGVRIRSVSYGWYMMDPGSGWADYIANQMLALVNANPQIDGIFADDVWDTRFFTWGMLTVPDSSVPASVISNWNANMITCLQKVKTALGSKYLIINSPEPNGLFAPYADGVMFEGLFHPQWKGMNDYSWWGSTNPMNAVAVVETLTASAPGKLFWILDGVSDLPSNPTQAQIDQAHSVMMLSLVGTLLGVNTSANLCFAFQPDYGGGDSYWAETDLPIGTPIGARYGIAGQTNLWARNFSNGRVYLNADTVAKTVVVGTTTYTIAPRSGLIVTGAPTPTYALTILATTGGTTSPVPGTYSYSEGTVLSVTAIPYSNYRFVNWLLDGVTRTENPIVVTMDKDHVLEAVFEYVTPPPITATIQGIISDKVTGLPVAGATVTCNGYVDITEVNGSYAFIDVPAGIYNLQVTKENYVSTEFSVDASAGGVIIVDVPISPTPIARGCFIATVAFGSPFAEELNVFRRFRDKCLPQQLTQSYYKYGRYLAQFIKGKRALKRYVRQWLTVLVKLLKGWV